MEIKLNEQQEELANFRGGHCITLASAGSGKTATILERTRRLISSGVDPNNIMILTFSKKSVADLKERIDTDLKGVYISNFHSMCLQTLKIHGDNRELVIGWKLVKFFTDKYGEEFPVGELQSWISFQKSHMRKFSANGFVEKETSMDAFKLPLYYKEYQKFMSDHSFFDFDDMLLDFVDLLKKDEHIRDYFTNQYQYIMVDEHQDSSRVQNEILKLITGAGNLVCIGDIKQNIYNFRGSDLGICLDFKDDWENAKVIQLPINYRSTKDIVDVSNAFIKPSFENYDLYADALAHQDTLGTVVGEFSSDNVVPRIQKLIQDKTEPKDIAVLVRTNDLGGTYELELRSMGIPCVMIGGKSFLDRMEINVIMSYLKLSVDNTDYGSFKNVYNTPNRFLSKKFIDKVGKTVGMSKEDLFGLTQRLKNDIKPYELRGYRDFARAVESIDPNGNPENQIDMILKTTELEKHLKHTYDDYEVRIKAIGSLKKIASKYKTIRQFLFMIQNLNTDKTKNAVQIMTVHKSKGLEFDHVFVASVDNEIFPHIKSSDEEERRLFYVAISRAIRGLYVSGTSKFVIEIRDIIGEDTEELSDEEFGDMEFMLEDW